MSRAPSPSRVQEVLDLALARPVHERAAFIAGMCGDDRHLREEVDSLLGALDAGGELLEPPPIVSTDNAAPLTGLTFGNYRVGDRVGEGGMGVVYRAQDTRLGRAVAVKALPPSLARDSHRRARFEHEARVLASLNHPNIAAIYGVEDSPRGQVLVLELVEGETLSRRLQKGVLPPDEAVAIAVRIARGLEAAHAAGIVHRDLKPSNVQLTPDGNAKILDFGVAKQVTAPGGTRDEPGRTIDGSIIGTAAYMSPEQARARPVDRRTDLWALGCVLFEMLAGTKAFPGETVSDTVAAVLRVEPDWSRLPADTPAAAIRVIRRCLEKDQDLRQRDAGDVALELAEQNGTRALSLTPTNSRRARAVAIGITALLAGAGLIAALVRPTAPPAHLVRFQLTLLPEQAVMATPGGAMTISPDGRTLVFAGGSVDSKRLYSRRFDSLETVALAGTSEAGDPCFSPDGRWIAFVAADQIRRVPAGGGGPEVLVPSGVDSSGLAWDERGIVYLGSRPWGLRRLAPDGTTSQVTKLDIDKEFTHAHPDVLPGGAVCFTRVVMSEGGYSARVEVARPTGERTVVVEDAACAQFFPPDRLLFWQSGVLKCARFDPATLRLTDGPTEIAPLAGGELHQPRRFALSPQGVLATLPGNVRQELTRLAWFEQDGSSADIFQGILTIDSPRLSPDGGKVAMIMGHSNRGDLWTWDLRRSSKQKLTSGRCYHHPVWSRDGKHIYCTAAPTDGPVRIERMIADGTAPPEVLWQAPDAVWAYATDMAPDGRILITMTDPGGTGIDLYGFDPETRERPRRLMPTVKHRLGARLSPDGSLIAYTSEETGRAEVYLQQFPSMEQKICLSTNGGYRPTWTADGKRVLFRLVGSLMAVDISRENDRLMVSPVRSVLENLPDARFDVDQTGRRFLMPRPAGDVGPQLQINIDLNWSPPGT